MGQEGRDRHLQPVQFAWKECPCQDRWNLSPFAPSLILPKSGIFRSWGGTKVGMQANSFCFKNQESALNCLCAVSQTARIAISPDLHICIHANEEHDLHFKNGASGALADLGTFWVLVLALAAACWQEAERCRQSCYSKSLAPMGLGEFWLCQAPFPSPPGPRCH